MFADSEAMEVCTGEVGGRAGLVTIARTVAHGRDAAARAAGRDSGSFVQTCWLATVELTMRGMSGDLPAHAAEPGGRGAYRRARDRGASPARLRHPARAAVLVSAVLPGDGVVGARAEAGAQELSFAARSARLACAGAGRAGPGRA